MKKTNLILLAAVFILTSASGIFAQMTVERRVIEVTGSAEMLVTPNEFTFKITLLERIEDKKKITIETQEANLKSELGKIGVDVAKDLTVFDLTSVYISQKKTKDTLGSKDYRLKLKDLEQIGRLQEIADRLNISRLDLVEATHSELPRFRRETKIEATKAAKNKAEYMLGAIGERIGKAVFIKEIENDEDDGYQSNLRSNNNLSSNSNTFVIDGQESSNKLGFSKIKIRYEVLARFEIE
ncbi:MAG TPA: SIMPL domain-containing protein [Pyrinomonadaceae bacterium]|nr:SIMPL domain-containing protein [Pyrinomonadaceae bacterium]